MELFGMLIILAPDHTKTYGHIVRGCLCAFVASFLNGTFYESIKLALRLRHPLNECAGINLQAHAVGFCRAKPELLAG
jgi:hypothetical protein